MIGAHRNHRGEFTLRRDEHPLKRVNPSGETVYVARYTDQKGQRRSNGTYAKAGPCRTARADGSCCAQHAIVAAYELDVQAPVRRDTVGGYFEKWLVLHPRSERTNYTMRGRVLRVLDADLDGRKLREIPLADLRRSDAVLLIDVLLRERGLAASGAQGVLSTLGTMWRDARDDGFLHADAMNPFLDLRVSRADPRVRKAPRRIRVWSWEEMHALCAAAGAWEPMLRVLSDCGLRLGEMLPLERRHWHGDSLEVRQTAWRGGILAGTKTDHGEADAGRVVPVPPALEALLRAMPKRIDSPLLFPTVTGLLWQEANWYRLVWAPARRVSGVAATPHEFRHSWISCMRAAGLDVADIADAAGHTVETQTRVYTHALGRSFDAMRSAVGE